MYALTIRPPWAQAIVRGPKRIENRTWKPSAKLYGQRIAIHCGRRYDAEGAEEMSALWWPPGVKAVANELGCLIGSVRLAGVVTDTDDPWFSGPFGWVMFDVRRLVVPVRCVGRQGLWDVPDGIF